MNGETMYANRSITHANGTVALIGPPWSIASTGDFHQDSRPDIVWRNSTSGATEIWYMGTVNGNVALSTWDIRYPNGALTLIGPPWKLVGTNKFNSTGSDDLLWYNTSTGETQIWYMNGGNQVSTQTVTAGGVAALVGPPWSIVKH